MYMQPTRAIFGEENFTRPYYNTTRKRIQNKLAAPCLRGNGLKSASKYSLHFKVATFGRVFMCTESIALRAIFKETCLLKLSIIS